MGNKPQKSRFQSLLPPLPESYIQSSQAPILQHPQLPSIRPYIMLLNTDQQNICIDSVNFRKEHKQQFIQILYGEVLKCQKEYRKIKVYTENIVICLQNLINVHFSDLVPVFYWVFRGFKLLVGKFGMFVPDPRMIGFNQNGEVKVWCNIKYTRSKPQISYSQLDQEKMVEMLIQIFSSKIDISSIPIDTQRRKFHINAKNFDEAIKYIQSQVQSVQLIPRNIRGIVALMQAGRKIKQSQIISMNSQYYNKDLDKTIKFQYSDPDPNAKPKTKINFSFNGLSSSNMTTGQVTPKKIRNSASLPKITFSTGTTPSTTNKQPQNMEQSDRTQQKSRVELDTKITSPMSININIPAHSSQKSKNKINFNFVSNQAVDVKVVTNRTSLEKDKGRSTSLIKFTYQ